MSNVIVFDGVCVLCTAWLRFVLKHDHAKLYKFSTMQSPAGRELLALHDLNPDDPATLLVLTAEKAYTDSDGMIRVVSSFGGLWRMINLLRIVPAVMRDLVYRFVGRHRYRLFGKHQTCIVPDVETLDRFVLLVSDLEAQDS